METPPLHQCYYVKNVEEKCIQSFIKDYMALSTRYRIFARQKKTGICRVFPIDKGFFTPGFTVLFGVKCKIWNYIYNTYFRVQEEQRCKATIWKGVVCRCQI